MPSLSPSALSGPAAAGRAVAGRAVAGGFLDHGNSGLLEQPPISVIKKWWGWSTP
jgi:hypothetical protein